MDWSLLLQEIEKYDSIAIYRHENPDVDACGSQFGLKTWLNNNYPEKHVYAFGEEVCTQRYFPENDIEEEDIVKNCLAISLDTANEPRLDGKYFNVAKKKIKIDHHPNREPYGDLVFVDPKYAGSHGFDAPVYTPVKPLQKDMQIGSFHVEVTKTPGHTKGSCVIRYRNLLFTGDTLFAGSIGRTDLYGGNEAEMMQSLTKFMDMAHDLIVLPGHGPRSTIKQELATNMYLQYVKKMVNI